MRPRCLPGRVIKIRDRVHGDHQTNRFGFVSCVADVRHLARTDARGFAEVRIRGRASVAQAGDCRESIHAHYAGAEWPLSGTYGISARSDPTRLGLRRRPYFGWAAFH